MSNSTTTSTPSDDKPQPSTVTAIERTYRICIQETTVKQCMMQERGVIGQEVAENRSDGTPLEKPMVLNTYGLQWVERIDKNTVTVYEQVRGSIDISKVIAAVNDWPSS